MTEVALARSRWTCGRGCSCPWIPEREPGTCPLIAFLWELPWTLLVSRRADPVRGHTFRSLSILLAPGTQLLESTARTQCASAGRAPRVTPPQHTPSSPPLHPLSCTCAMLNACVASTPQRPSSQFWEDLFSPYTSISLPPGRRNPGHHRPTSLSTFVCALLPACQAQEETYSPQLLLSLKKKCKLFSCSRYKLLCIPPSLF